MDVLATVLLVIIAIAIWLYLDPANRIRRYNEAVRKDLDYYHTHPGCTLEEAHRNRERFHRRNGF